MKQLSSMIIRAKIFCAVSMLLVGYNLVSLLLFNLTTEQTAEFVLKGQIMTFYFFIANIWHDFLLFKVKPRICQDKWSE